MLYDKQQIFNHVSKHVKSLQCGAVSLFSYKVCVAPWQAATCAVQLITLCAQQPNIVSIIHKRLLFSAHFMGKSFFGFSRPLPALTYTLCSAATFIGCTDSEEHSLKLTSVAAVLHTSRQITFQPQLKCAAAQVCVWCLEPLPCEHCS